MSEYDQWDDTEDDDQDPGFQGNGNANALKQLRDANRKLSKANKELTEQLDALKVAERTRSVKDAIKARGLNEKIANLVPKDLTTSDEVEAWVNDYADVFGAPAPVDQQDEQPPALSPELEAWNRISQSQQQGQPFSSDPDQMLGLIKATQDPDALNALLFGNKLGPAAS